MFGVRRGMALSAVALALAGTSCTAAHHPRAAALRPHASTTQGTSPGPIYRVITDVETAPNGVAVLCGPGETTSGGGPVGAGAMPPPCGKIHVLGMPSHITGSRTVGDYSRTPPLLLVGHWDGRSLILTRAPKPTKQVWQLDPGCLAGPGPNERPDPRLVARIAADRDALRRAGSDVYTVSTCGSSIIVGVPVDDRATESLFAARYGPSVHLFGWLRI